MLTSSAGILTQAHVGLRRLVQPTAGQYDKKLYLMTLHHQSPPESPPEVPEDRSTAHQGHSMQSIIKSVKIIKPNKKRDSQVPNT